VPAPNKLAEILARGTLIIATDPAYPPQSDLIEGAVRPVDTNCTADQYTAAEFEGFDIEVAGEMARRLGVEACFIWSPSWEQVTGGHWDDSWDISVASMAITPERMENLYFTQPYYTSPAAFFVRTDNHTTLQPSDLSGQTVGVCRGCTYEAYLNGSLELPGQELEFVVKEATITGYATDMAALHDLTVGDGQQLDAVLTSLPTGQSLIANGLPLKQLGQPVFTEYLAVAVDRHHRLDPVPLVERVTDIIQTMHADGTLLKLSQQYYGLDLSTAAAEFEVEALGQFR
jgi:polar amino acid transport system substrate-binding protein